MTDASNSESTSPNQRGGIHHASLLAAFLGREDVYYFPTTQGLRLRHLAERVMGSPYDPKNHLNFEEQEAAIELAKAFLEAHQANLERVREMSR